MNDPESGDRPITVEFVLELLSSQLKLDRERGVVKLEKLLNSWEKPSDDTTRSASIVAGRQQLQSSILAGLLCEDEEVDSRPSNASAGTPLTGSRPVSRSSSISILDEQNQSGNKHSYLMACYPLIATSTKDDKEFLQQVRDISIKLIQHSEIRVKVTAGGVLGFLSKYLGPSVYEISRELILDLITENLKPVCEISEEDELKSIEQGFDVTLPAFVIREKVMRESIAWKHLEPSLKCLQFMIENLECEFIPFMEHRLVTLIFESLLHPVRYVRETGFQIITSLLTAAPDDVKEFAHQLSHHLANGLSDNWNQVRMAAAIATRRFFLMYCESKDEFYPVLLPKLCLNRYYKTDGIREYAQETWRLVTCSEGRFLVAKYIKNIVDCYLESTMSSNLAERETACACIAELGTKIERSVVLPHVVPLLEALLSCAENESWSVRDAASLACGNFVSQYPEESRTYMDRLFKLLFRNLEDPIQILRQGAATALGNLASSYGTEALNVILPKLTTGLNLVESMRARNSLDLSSLALPSSSEASVEARLTVADDNACVQHEPQCEFAVPGKTLVTSEYLMASISTGSSPPTPQLPSPCQSCRKSKLPQPWHLTDGCLFLLGSLTNVPECKSDLDGMLPLMIKATEEKSYCEHYTIHETFCKVLPLVAKAITKGFFKDSLYLLFKPIFYTVESVNPMTSEIGRNCLFQLAEFLGPNILRSRVDLYDSRFVHLIPE